MPFVIPLLLAAAPAASHQDVAALDRAVAGFTGHAVGEEGGARAAVDGRLRLAACPTVALSWRTAAQDAVVVACSRPSWRIFVPVKRSAPVAAVATPAARPAAPVKAEPVIKRGDPVVIEAGSSGFSISREGVAMNDAAPGARFAVRVDGKPTPVQAVAVEPGRATLPGWP